MYDWLKKVAERINKYLNAIVWRFKLLLRGEIQMIDMYVALIIAGRRTLEQVPERYRNDVEADLLALGLDGNGNPINP